LGQKRTKGKRGKKGGGEKKNLGKACAEEPRGGGGLKTKRTQKKKCKLLEMRVLKGAKKVKKGEKENVIWQFTAYRKGGGRKDERKKERSGGRQT